MWRSISVLLFLVCLSAFAVEQGPLEFGENEVKVGVRRPQVFRAESFGNMELELVLSPAKNLSLSLTGPYGAPRYGEQDEGKPVTTWSPRAGQDKLTGKLNLEKPGIYRITLTRSEGEMEETTLTAKCVKNCERPSLSPKELFAALDKSPETRPIRAELDTVLEELIPEKTVRGLIKKDIRKHLGEIVADTTRSPLVPPLFTFSPSLRPLLPGQEGRALPAPKVIKDIDFIEYLGDCTVDRTAALPDVTPKVPGLKYGHYLDQRLTDCMIAQSQKLAALMTALAPEKDSMVAWHTLKKIHLIGSVMELAEALIAEGHTIEVRNERTFANFIALAFDGKDTHWPLWIDSGLKLKSGKTFNLPLGHGQHTWYIEGPTVNARVSFFLGMYGAGFFPAIDRRPGWTGMRSYYRVPSRGKANKEFVLSTLFEAAKFFRDNREESTRLKLPLDGYGYTGVCMNSTAKIEYATRGSVTLYPLVRARELDKIASPIPYDADMTFAELEKPEVRRDTIRRILATIPFALDDKQLVDEDFRRDLAELQAELNGK